ncbi:MAG: SHOCT domain-containing protein [Thermoleophilia bacterium]|nr:SHOCT domain-containing protein [Thermoleophilia bacterium]
MNNGGHGFEHGMDGGLGVFGGILMMVFWAAIIVGIVLLVVWLTRQVAGGHYVGGSHGAGHTDTAIDILSQRYARGEIDKAEFEEKKKDLSG